MKGMLIIGKPEEGSSTRDEKPGYGDRPEPGDMAGMAERRASKDIMAAIESGDSAAFSKGLKAFAEACGWTGTSTEEADEGE